ncbi:hypothetical protein [Dactylosporangium salmoneum]|uniref:DUF5666 domain-containing protein n=1 Tax=Dactylosporangium salmoneum TaxID=53361 RepID=A0ABN3GFV2_9ACTN
MSSHLDQQPAAPVWAQPTPAAPAAPAPQPPATPPKSSRMKTVIVGVVAALVIGGGGFAVIKAASGDSSSTSQQAGPGGNGQGGPGGFGGGFMDRGANGLSGALYGDFTASDGNGGYTTKRLQSGTVTEVSTTSITAKSADGHATTFVIGSSTTVDNGNDQISDVKTGDTVTVVGTVDGSTVTATSITDTTLSQANGGNQQQGGGNGNGMPGGGGAPQGNGTSN